MNPTRSAILLLFNEDEMAPISAGPPNHIVRNKLTYTACYCEENIYLILRDHVAAATLPDYTVVFISNEQKCVPIWYQKICQGNLPLCWDYHVLLLYRCPTDRVTYVYDFDTKLQPFPVPFSNYFGPSLHGPSPWPSWPDSCVEAIIELHTNNPRKYKLVRAEDYLRLFASDRRHMLTTIRKIIGEPNEQGINPEPVEVEVYCSTPPEYAPITTEQSECTLPRFLDFSDSWVDGEYGRLIDEETFLQEFNYVELEKGYKVLCYPDDLDFRPTTGASKI